MPGGTTYQRDRQSRCSRVNYTTQRPAVMSQVVNPSWRRGLPRPSEKPHRLTARRLFFRAAILDRAATIFNQATVVLCLPRTANGINEEVAITTKPTRICR